MPETNPSGVNRVAIIGLGGMGRAMLSEMVFHPRFEVTAVFDPDARACTAASEVHPSLEFADAAEHLIRRDDVDLVYVASPPRSHGAYVTAICDARKSVFCEKPLGVDVEASRALAAYVEASGVANAVNFSHAASVDAARAEAALRDGILGNVARVDMRLHLPAWPRDFQKTAEWLRYRNQGGFTREVISHWVFLSQRLFGPGRVRFAHTHFPEDDRLAEDRLVAALDFSGVPALVSAAVGGRGPVGMEYTLWGSLRSLRLTSGGGMLECDDGEWRACFMEENSAPSDRQRSLDNLAGLLDGAPNTVAGIKDALAVQEVIEAILEGRSR